MLEWWEGWAVRKSRIVKDVLLVLVRGKVVINWSKMKMYKVVWLGQNDEKGEQLENKELKKNILSLVVRGWVDTN